MGNLLLIYSAVIFIIAVILFTYSELKKSFDEEIEIYRWIKIFSIVLLVIAVMCFVVSRSVAID
ncbi:MAG: hypothetical protein IJR29_02100 [Butyrivibrio sp.]|nr:hypothetical protein [Butyrivibrio sp.]